MGNKSELGLVASGSMGGDIKSDGEIPVMGIDEYGWFWTDQFVHEDSSGNGKRYIYLAFDTNNLVTRNNATANHGSVRGIKRVEREQVDENDYTKVGNVSASDDFLVYPYKSDAEFVVLSAKETIYKIFSTDGNLIQKGSLKTGVNILNIDTVPSGIYLICIDKLSFKIIKV